MMDARQRADARLHLAMLPAGVFLVVVSGVAFVAMLGLALWMLAVQGGNWGWYCIWGLAAAVIAARNFLKSIESLSALDVRGTLVTLGWSAAIVAVWPGWWLG